MIRLSKFTKKSRGFTIVELLVVIVVIGILAAITIVSYTGITSRAKASQAQSNANSVAQVANIYNSDAANTGFPANAAAITGYTTGAAKLPSGITVSTAAQNKPDSTDGQTTIYYMAKSGNVGGCIGWYDFANSNIKYVYVGTASAADFTVASPTCT